MRRKERLALIKKIVEDAGIKRQGDLVDILSKRGIEVTQATISRDINALGLTKMRDESGNSKYSKPELEDITIRLSRLKKRISDSYISGEPVGNLIVLHTTPGNAQSIAAAIDAVGFEEIAGTIAGDDTILIIARSQEDAANLISRITGLEEKNE
ncbi:MAG: arginine repressor [Actinobacteria bacterium]|nr:arginine repressor [Actinomycetota bacterium]